MTTRLAAPSLAALALLGASLAGCSDPLLFAAVDEPRLCLLMPMEEMPPAPPVGDMTVTWRGELDLGAHLPGLDRSDAVSGTLRMLSLTAQGSTDLSSVTAAEVAVLDEADRPTAFMHAARPGTDPTALEMVLDQDLDLLARLQGGRLRYAITLHGAPPQVAWTADVETCFAAHLTLDGLKLME